MNGIAGPVDYPSSYMEYFGLGKPIKLKKRKILTKKALYHQESALYRPVCGYTISYLFSDNIASLNWSSTLTSISKTDVASMYTLILNLCSTTKNDC